VIRQQVEVRGLVQGVGFRPFVYRLALEERIAGWVRNTPGGVHMELEANPEQVEHLLERLAAELPPLARLDSVRAQAIAPRGERTFAIRESALDGPTRALILPDCATCAECLADILSPGNRRYRYPFTNCTNCGPRYSIIRALPYDRSRTTMAGFAMCPACQAEYSDPRDRRFHAQPNACPKCGPQLSLLDGRGTQLAGGDTALTQAARAVREGGLLALKGLGGFQLLVRADDEAAVARLRRLKRRPTKPLAWMVSDLAQARMLAEVDELEARALTSPAAPIVLLRRRGGGGPYLGLMLPYTPLHHLLVREVGCPVVATSGNRAGEPLCIESEEALEKLWGGPDLFLVHNRPIARRLDDSVAFCSGGELRLVRRARGYAPLPLQLPEAGRPVHAVGGHQKATCAVSDGSWVYVGQHVGDLDEPATLAEHARVLADLQALTGLSEPFQGARDAHPDYASSRLAGPDAQPVWHHHAHLASCLAEHGRTGPALGVIWDGTGLGPDGTIWGGEFLRGDLRGFERVAHLRPFPLPGGERASREPLRSLAGLCFELGRPLPEAPRVWENMLRSGTLCPLTSSMGRLFDAVAWLLGLVSRVSFEGEAAMLLEYAVDPAEPGAYPFPVEAGVVDWAPALTGIFADQAAGEASGRIAARFHNGLVEAAVAVARVAAEPVVALSGGCMQNRLLLERLSARLREAGFEVLAQGRVPSNDGGLSLGQAAIVSALPGGTC